MLLLNMERHMGGAVVSSAWLISEHCVFWQLCFLVQTAHSRDLVNEHQRQTSEDPRLRYTRYSLSVPLKQAYPHSSFLKPSCDMVILQRQGKHTRNMQQVLLTCKNKLLVMLLRRTVCADRRHRHQRADFNSCHRKIHWDLENCTIHLAMNH